MGKVEIGAEYWTGYLLKFGDRVPGITEELTFEPTATYDVGRLYTQGPVTLITGDHPVGQIAHVKKTDEGVFVTVMLDPELPSDIQPFLNRLEWRYTVDRANITYAFRDNPQTGEKVKTLTSFPLLTVQYTIGGVSSGVQTPTTVINRPAGRRRKVVVGSRSAGNHPAADSAGSGHVDSSPGAAVDGEGSIGVPDSGS